MTIANKITQWTKNRNIQLSNQHFLNFFSLIHFIWTVPLQFRKIILKLVHRKNFLKIALFSDFSHLCDEIYTNLNYLCTKIQHH